MTLTTVGFSLSACNSVPSSGCPPLIRYSAETQKKAAEELRRLPPGSPLAKLVVDYKKMRDACRIGAL